MTCTKIVVSGIAIVLFLSLGMTTAHAQEIALGFHGGFIKSSGIMDTGFYIGGQYRYKLSPAFGYEIALDYRDETSSENLEYKGKSYHATTIARSYPLTGTLIFTIFAEKQLPLNLFGGVGLYFYTLTFRPEGQSSETENDVRFGYHLGAGTEYEISLGVKLDGSVRYVFLDLQNEYGDVVLSDPQSNALMLYLGLNFYF
ncbi:outer membrane beta-barrel protein [bacterium]|nr:outer membrane beta-barrel protein [bacterium]